MGEARRKRLLGIGPIKASFADIDVAIEDLEKYIEAGQVKGFVQIARLQNVGPGVFPIKLWTMGLEKQEAYDVICQMKDAFEKTMGFKDD
jgi:hypothetical protein